MSTTSPAEAGVPDPAPGPGIDPIARIRHDLRTPASHILGYVEMLLEEAAAGPAGRLAPDLKRIEDAGHRLLDLIREELAPDRIASGRLDLRHLHAELRTPLNHVIGYSEILMEQAEAAGLTSLLPDLQKVHLAGHTFLRLVAERLTAARLQPPIPGPGPNPNPGPGPAVAPTAHPDALALSRDASPAPNTAGGTPLTGTVLIVDDDAGNRELLERRLRRQGFEVVSAENGPAALDLLTRRKIDLILLDLVMPGMDGDQVLARLKADPRLRDLPVLMLSALDEMDTVVRCILIGAEDYLSKPFNSVLLRARLSACLEKHRLRRLEQEHLHAIEVERQKSDSLLRNILPEAIARRLKGGETTIVDSLPEVSVLFADLVGFTELAAHLPSVELVRLLDDIFSAFDTLAEAQGLEKIKTIGDAYMVVGGLPTPRTDHAEAVAELALNMIDQVRRQFAGYPAPIRLRIGINSGPVIAGIIGRHKFNYDLWGDTVNTASRMESHGLPGRIQVTEGSYLRLRHRYAFERRGDIEVKGKGRLPTWFLTGRLPGTPPA